MRAGSALHGAALCCGSTRTRHQSDSTGPVSYVPGSTPKNCSNTLSAAGAAAAPPWPPFSIRAQTTSSAFSDGPQPHHHDWSRSPGKPGSGTNFSAVPVLPEIGAREAAEDARGRAVRRVRRVEEALLDELRSRTGRDRCPCGFGAVYGRTTIGGDPPSGSARSAARCAARRACRRSRAARTGASSGAASRGGRPGRSRAAPSRRSSRPSRAAP